MNKETYSREDLKIWINENLWTKTRTQLNSAYISTSSKFYNSNIDYFNSIIERTNYLTNVKIGERIYHILNDLYSAPICPVCNKDKIVFNTVIKGYYKSCSQTCMQKNKPPCKKYYNTSTEKVNLTIEELQVWCKENLFTDNGKINQHKIKNTYKFYNDNIEYFNAINSYINFTDDIHYRERIKSFIDNIFENPKCKVCNKPVKYNYGWALFCSNKCGSSKESIKHKVDNKSKVLFGTLKLNKENIKNWIKENIIINNIINSNLVTPSSYFYNDNFYILDYIDKNVKIDNIGLGVKCKLFLEDIFENPKCKVCNTNLKYQNGSFGVYCSVSCYAKTEEFKLNNKNIWNNRSLKERQEIINKAKFTKLVKYNNENFNNREKAKDTMLEKYSVEFYPQSKSWKEQIENFYNNLSEDEKNLIIIKRKETNLLNYGVEYYTQTNEYKEKYLNTIQNKYGEDITHHTQVQEVQEAKFKTCLTRYGIRGTVGSHNIKQYRETLYSNGNAVRYEDKEDFEHYVDKVLIYTAKNYHKYFYYINPTNLKRSKFDYHLDHILSKAEGFKNNIPIWIICHPCNLRMLWYSDNISKNLNSDISLEELLDKIEKFEKERS